MAKDNVPGAAVLDRRVILKLLAVNAVALPTVDALGVTSAPAAPPQVGASSGDVAPVVLPRGFADPLLELTRLLRKAAELEHAFLLTYLYAAFSLKPEFASIGGFGSDDGTNLIGAAIARMMHFGAINRLLVALGAAPHLAPPRFPYTPDTYAFAFNLEGFSRPMLSRHIYHEAAPDFFADAAAKSSDTALADAILALLGAPPKRRASLYGTIVEVAGEIARSAEPDLPDMARWIPAIRSIDEGGRADRFQFFVALFLGSHPALAEHGNVWRLPLADPQYPSYDLPVNPASNARQPGRIADQGTAALVRLANLQYWTALLLLDLNFRQHANLYRDLAVKHMSGPLRSLGRHLPSLGIGIAFDAIEIPDSSALGAKQRLRFVTASLREGQGAADAIGARLPSDYPLSINRETMARLGVA